MVNSIPDRIVAVEKQFWIRQNRAPTIPQIFMFRINLPFTLISQIAWVKDIITDKNQQKYNQSGIKEAVVQFKGIRNDGKKQVIKFVSYLRIKRKVKFLSLPKFKDQSVLRKENTVIILNLVITLLYNITQEIQWNIQRQEFLKYFIQVVKKRVEIQNIIYYDIKVVFYWLTDQNQSLTKKIKSIGIIIFILGPYAWFFYQLIFRFMVYKDRKVDDQGTDPQQFIFYLSVIVMQMVQNDNKVKNRQKQKLLVQAKEDEYKKANNLQTLEDEEREKRFLILREKEKSKKKTK